MRENETGRVCSTYGKIKNAYKIANGKSEGKIPLGGPRRTLEDIKMDIKEIGYEGVD
jgi:hypothetical protein